MKLLAARCPECSHPLAPENDHVVIACDQCFTTVHIGDEGISRMPVRYAAPEAGASAGDWLPFWVFNGRVHMIKRDTQGGDRASGQEAMRLWGQPRNLYVPAWELPLDLAQTVGSAMTQRQPVYQPIPRPAQVRLRPASVTADDALKILEFVVLAIEARRRDWLKSLEFRLDVGQPEMWALPADESR